MLLLFFFFFLPKSISKHYFVGRLLFIYGDLVHVILLGKQVSERFPQFLGGVVLRLARNVSLPSLFHLPRSLRFSVLLKLQILSANRVNAVLT